MLEDADLGDRRRQLRHSNEEPAGSIPAVQRKGSATCALGHRIKIHRVDGSAVPSKNEAPAWYIAARETSRTLLPTLLGARPKMTGLRARGSIAILCGAMAIAGCGGVATGAAQTAVSPDRGGSS